MQTLSEVQSSVAAALFDVAAPIPDAFRGARRRRAGRRFDIYRKTVASSLNGVLTDRYPVTRQLIGPESFDALARSYTVQFPPASPVLLNYGESLPQFIRGLGRTPSIEYLADIADLESARCRAYHAADATPALLAASLQRQAPFAGLTIWLHPSASLVTSRFPIVSIWESNIREDDSPIQWKPEAALVARPELDVGVWRLPKGGYEFLAAIMDGQELGVAAKRAATLTTEFDFDESIELLIRSNACIGVNEVSLLAA